MNDTYSRVGKGREENMINGKRGMVEIIIGGWEEINRGREEGFKKI
jgi:hypothetical protein